MSDYESDTPAPEPAPAPSKPKRESKKMTDSQKADLKKHMDKMKKDGMTLTEQRSHRMRLMSKMRQDPKMSARKAHTAISKK